MIKRFNIWHGFRIDVDDGTPISHEAWDLFISYRYIRLRLKWKKNINLINILCQFAQLLPMNKRTMDFTIRFFLECHFCTLSSALKFTVINVFLSHDVTIPFNIGIQCVCIIDYLSPDPMIGIQQIWIVAANILYNKKNYQSGQQHCENLYWKPFTMQLKLDVNCFW